MNELLSLGVQRVEHVKQPLPASASLRRRTALVDSNADAGPDSERRRHRSNRAFLQGARSMSSTNICSRHAGDDAANRRSQAISPLPIAFIRCVFPTPLAVEKERVFRLAR
jgi:hypothetical protein